jgi:hypothetical protein
VEVSEAEEEDVEDEEASHLDPHDDVAKVVVAAINQAPQLSKILLQVQDPLNQSKKVQAMVLKIYQQDHAPNEIVTTSLCNNMKTNIEHDTNMRVVRDHLVAMTHRTECLRLQSHRIILTDIAHEALASSMTDITRPPRGDAQDLEDARDPHHADVLDRRPSARQHLRVHVT